MFLRDQAFDPFRQLVVPILSGVGPGLGQVEVLLVFQRLGCGAVSDPVFMELVEMLDSLQHNDDRCQPTGHPYRAVHRGHDWQ